MSFIEDQDCDTAFDPVCNPGDIKRD